MSNYEVLSAIIKGRRSVFPASYTTQEISDTVIKQILESANYAPTHKLTQPWRFVVVKNDAKNRLGAELGKIYKEIIPAEKFMQKKFESIPVKVNQANCIIAINVQFSGKIPEWEEIAAVSCAVQNMSLVAETLNVGAYWSSPPLIAGLGDFLSLAENEKCLGLFYMGYHEDEPREANRTPIESKVKWLDQ